MGKESKLKELTIEEKLTLLTGASAMSAVDLPNRGLEGVWMADGPCGVKTKDGNAVCFMNTGLMAASWDREICYEIGAMIGDEATRCGVDLMLIPAINIKRNPLAGRNFEYYSEDPYLTGTLAAEYVNGLKAQGAITCVKHFACNNQESYRWSQNSILDDDTLRNIYLKAFEIVIKNTQVDSVMAAYNLINGEYACQNKYLLTDILRGEWNFNGVVMSDWCAATDVVQSVKNGMDLEMPGNLHNSLPKLKKAYETGELSIERIDEAVERLLALQEKKPQKRLGAPISVDIEKLVKMTAESFVLLKNDGVLPLVKSEKLLLVGTAKDPRIQGGGCAKLKTNFVTLPYEEIKKYATDCDNIDGYNVSGVNGTTYDKIIVFLTLPEDCDSEAFDRTTMAFPQEQLSAIAKLKEQNENIVVVLQNGSAVEIPFETDVKGIL
jgi:beta-glucosidase